MKRILALVLLVMLCTGAAGCASVGPPVTKASPKASQMPPKASRATPKPSPDAAPAVTPGDTPEAADTEEALFFYAPPAGEPGEAEIRIYKERRALELVMDGEVAGRFPSASDLLPRGTN